MIVRDNINSNNCEAKNNNCCDTQVVRVYKRIENAQCIFTSFNSEEDLIFRCEIGKLSLGVSAEQGLSDLDNDVLRFLSEPDEFVRCVV